MKQILVVVALAIVAIALLAFIQPPEKEADIETAPGTVALTELGVSLVLPTGLDGLVTGTTTVPGIGTVLHVAVPVAGTSGSACELGSFYRVEKASLGSPEAPWSEESLEAATIAQDGVPPQAKEFPEFYFVFEPSQVACANDASQLEVEIALRQALWIAVSTATLLPVEPSQASGVEEYLRTHINELSPEPTALGGTFYVTAVEAADGAGTVSYEDGHMAYVADFTYTLDARGMPQMTSFTIR